MDKPDFSRYGLTHKLVDNREGWENRSKTLMTLGGFGIFLCTSLICAAEQKEYPVFFVILSVMAFSYGFRLYSKCKHIKKQYDKYMMDSLLYQYKDKKIEYNDENKMILIEQNNEKENKDMLVEKMKLKKYINIYTVKIIVLISLYV